MRRVLATTWTVQPLAFASLLFSVAWVVGLGSLAGILLGLASIARIRRTGGGGHGVAVAGVVLGVAGVVATAVLLLGGAQRGTELTHICRDVATGQPC